MKEGLADREDLLVGRVGDLDDREAVEGPSARTLRQRELEAAAAAEAKAAKEAKAAADAKESIF